MKDLQVRAASDALAGLDKSWLAKQVYQCINTGDTSICRSFYVQLC